MAPWAQVPPVVPGFPHAQSCTPGQLLYRQVGLDRVTNIIYHNGRIYSNNVGAGERREWLFTNPAQASSLAIVNTTGLPFMTDQGNHAHTKSGDYAGGVLGLRFRRISPGINNNNEEMPVADRFYNVQTDPPGGSQHRLYFPWSTPFNWIQYGTSTGSARLWRADQLLAEWQPLADHGVAGNSILIGNLLFVISDGSMLGVLVYDIAPVFATPAQPPALLDKFTGPVGAYIGAVWENYLVLAGGADQDQIFVIDYSDPTDLRLVTTLNVRGNNALNAGSNVPYVRIQDQYVFTRRHKIDMESLSPVLELDEVGNNRPAGSVAGQLDVSQYNMPLGNLLITGGYSSVGRDGVGVWCHQATPDTRAPYVGYHVPKPGQTNFPRGAPISLIIAENLESYTIINGQTVIIRPIGGAAVDAWTSFSHDGVLTITPKQYLASNTTYEVIIPAGGIKDAAGNGIQSYTFTFSTGGNVGGGNAAPQIANLTANPAPVAPGIAVALATTASDTESDPLQYRYSFGDGTATTAWGSASGVSHTFADSGHYDIKVQVRDVKPDGSHSVTSRSLSLAVAPVPAGPLPTQSSQLALDAANRRIWAVDPDNDMVSRFDADTRQRLQTIQLGALLGLSVEIAPVSIAIAPNGEAWVALRDADRIAVLSASGQLLASIDTGFGSAPQAVAVSRDGSRVFATLGGRGTIAGNGLLVRYSTATRSETGRTQLGGPHARAIAITGDGARVFVSRFISREHYGEVWEVNGNTMGFTRTIELWRDRGLYGLDAGGSDGPGVPNYISSLTLSPQQDWLWYTGIKTDTNRGTFFRQQTENNLTLTHDATVRSMLGRIQLTHPSGTPQEPNRDSIGSQRGRVDIDNSDSPSALVFSPRGDYVFVAQQGNDAVAVFDDLAIRDGVGRSSLWRFATGAAPQALLWDPATDVLWSRDLMGRNVTTFPLAAFIAVGNRQLIAQTIALGSGELLPPSVLAGKRTFYFAGNAPDGQNAMSFEGYISCASCHIDGSQDGRVWDFTQRGEGLRNTTDLRGRAGMVHGNVHWSGNFDEIQDFNLDIVGQFRGRGFLPTGQTSHPPLGISNSGRSALLDQLADYVTSLSNSTVPRSPYRQADGTRTATAIAGAAVFQNLGCATCHLPARDFTDSTLGVATLRNVGTLRSSSGQRLGAALTGIDTPTLNGIWDTAPYFHDGSAAALDEVFTVAGGRMYEAEAGLLAGGAALPGYPTINEDSTFHGHMVAMESDGARVTFSNVDGGSGGIGAVELRWWPGSGGTVRINVNNGAFVHDRIVQIERTHFEWGRIRVDGVPLNAGTNNTIEVRRVSVNSWRSPGLDNITVSTAADLALAAPHRAALALTTTDMDRLRAYLFTLDGRDALGVPISINQIFGSGFE